MTILTVYPIDLLLYVPQQPLDSPYPVGEFRGHKEVAGDASGGYVGFLWAPVTTEQGRQFVWVMDAYTGRINNTYVAGTYHRWVINTGEDYQVYASGHSGPDGTAWGMTEFYLNPVPMVPHRPDAALTNSYGVYISNNAAGRNFEASIHGYIYHPEVRTRAGGMVLPPFFRGPL